MRDAHTLNRLQRSVTAATGHLQQRPHRGVPADAIAAGVFRFQLLSAGALARPAALTTCNCCCSPSAARGDGGPPVCARHCGHAAPLPRHSCRGALQWGHVPVLRLLGPATTLSRRWQHASARLQADQLVRTPFARIYEWLDIAQQFVFDDPEVSLSLIVHCTAAWIECWIQEHQELCCVQSIYHQHRHPLRHLASASAEAARVCGI